MTVLEILGFLGGTLYVIHVILAIAIGIHKAAKKYYMDLGAIEERNRADDDDEKPTPKMGFKTREEQLENQLKSVAHELRIIKESKRA